MSNFIFIKAEWPDLHDAAGKAEALVYSDPRAACFYARRALELAVHWLYKHDSTLKLPYQDNLSALIHEPSFKAVAGEAVFSKARVINTLGNRAVHGPRPIPVEDALVAVRELFHFCFWLARTYSRMDKPADGLRFDTDLALKSGTGILPVGERKDIGGTPVKHGQDAHATLEQLQRLETQLRERDEKLTVLLTDKTTLDEELTRLRAEIAEAKKANAVRPDEHNYSETETRDYFIDLLLKEAGWALDQERDREYPVDGMPNNQGKGFVDYVLWGDDGLPLALGEAKRTRRDSRVGQRQAE